jgi:endonuclease I
MRLFIFSIVSIFTLLLVAQPPATYYSSANGKSDAQLKTALYGIISNGYVDKDYDFLYTIYQTSDVKADGKVWDMYSTCTWTPGQKLCGNQSQVCDCYNREHSIPSSWFNKSRPMYSDAFHIYPTDGRVNNFRGNMPYGETNSASLIAGDNRSLGKIGTSSFSGYSGTVFEPVDEYKGDFARTYFYFATRYENIMTSIGGESFNGTKYPAFTTWSKNLFLKWHRQDPVSEKEITRNNAIYVHQKNRNPFIDHPELAEYIWGDKTGTSWANTSAVDNPEVAAYFSYNQATKVIRMNINQTPMRYSIISISGQLVKTGTAEPFESISVSNIRTGLYFVRFETNQIKTIRKFIIQ